LCVAILSVVAIGFTCAEAFACGDKFLRAGRSARFRAYASVHPSPILVYAPKWTRKGISEFEQILTRAGHAPATVTTAAAMSQALAGGKYEVVIMLKASHPPQTSR
jgi:hypothetical protein